MLRGCALCGKLVEVDRLPPDHVWLDQVKSGEFAYSPHGVLVDNGTATLAIRLPPDEALLPR